MKKHYLKFQVELEVDDVGEEPASVTSIREAMDASITDYVESKDFAREVEDRIRDEYDYDPELEPVAAQTKAIKARLLR